MRPESITLPVCVNESFPGHYVMESEDGTLWFVPATLRGWEQRQRYIGHRAGLRPVEGEHTCRAVRTLTGAPE